MRRGLLGWNPDEVPQAALDARIARCHAALRADGLDALLIYTSFPRPAAVSYLTHFIPYWSQGALLVRPEGPTVLLASLSKRVGNWIEETSYLGEVISTPRLGAEAARRILAAGPAPKRVGVVELPKLPGGIARPLAEALPNAALVDATALFRGVRQPADEAEIAMTRRAAEIAGAALDQALSGRHRETAPLLGAIEATARLMGAEEVQTLIAPDLAADDRLRRMEGSAALAERYFVRVSVAYKGHWVRLGRTIAAGEVDPNTPRVVDGLASLGDGRDMASVVAVLPGLEAGATVVSWTAEGCTGSAPLATLWTGEPPDAGAIIVVNATLRRGDDPPWLVSEPVLLADEEGSAATPLTTA